MSKAVTRYVIHQSIEWYQPRHLQSKHFRLRMFSDKYLQKVEVVLRVSQSYLNVQLSVPLRYPQIIRC